MPEMILPGTYIEVRDEGLIRAGSVVTGNIGIVGTANKGPVNTVKLLSSLSEAREIFGDKDNWIDGNSNELTLIRALELIYQNGGRTVYAVRVANQGPIASSYVLKTPSVNLQFLAKAPGSAGNNLQIEIVSSGSKKKLQVYNYKSFSVTFSTAEDLSNKLTADSNLKDVLTVEALSSGDDNKVPDSFTRKSLSGGNASTKATLAVDGGGKSPLFTLTAKNNGEDRNLTDVEISDADSGNKKLTVYVPDVAALTGLATVEDLINKLGDDPGLSQLLVAQPLGDKTAPLTNFNKQPLTGGSDSGPIPSSYILKVKPDELVQLKARALGSWGDQIEVSKSQISGTQKQKLELTRGPIEEVHTFETTEDLLKSIKNSSTLVEAERASGVTESPEKLFSGGDDGANATSADYAAGLELLENEIVNIVLLAGQGASKDETDMATLLQGHLKKTEGIKRERIGIIGCLSDDIAQLQGQPSGEKRLIFVAPGLKMVEVDRQNQKKEYTLPGGYTAAAVAGLIASLPVQTSPTNKTLVLSGLSVEFNDAQLKQLVQDRVLVIEKRNGFRIVKGITTNDAAWQQITTRRIVDYAIYGVRSSCDPYIGRLNNERVRGALKATINSFLTGMVQDEALVGYTLDVSATRDQEIEGKVMVTMTLQPTFSIDYIQVTMYLG